MNLLQPEIDRMQNIKDKMAEFSKLTKGKKYNFYSGEWEPIDKKKMSFMDATIV